MTVRPSSLRPSAQQWWRSSEKLRFVVVGVFNTVLGYGLFALAFVLLEERLHYLGIVVVAHFCATGGAFLAHRRLVFRSAEPAHRQFLRFNLNHLGLVAGSLLLLPLLVERLHLHPIPGQGIVVVFAALLSYPLHKHLTFGGSHE